MARFEAKIFDFLNFLEFIKFHYERNFLDRLTHSSFSRV